VDFVDDVDFELGSHGPDADGGTQLANVVDTAIGRAIDFHDVDVISGGDTLADIALVAGNTVDGVGAIECFGEDSGGGRFADSPCAREHVSVGDTTGTNGVAECFGDVLLANNVVEGLRPKATGEYSVVRA